MVEYPREIFCQWGNNQQINAEYQLQPAREESGESPMALHAGNLSRYVLTIVDKSGGTTKVVSANIPWNEVSSIREKTRRAGMMMDMNKMFFQHGTATEEKPVSSAYTQTISFGYFKGKTPADVLLEDPKNLDQLKNTRGFFEKNAEKYPANKKVMTAIDEAIALLNEGKLEKKSVDTGTAQGSYVIYERQFKHKKPYVEGKRTIYSMKISCEFDKKYPWHIEITNCLAPMKPGAGGNLLPEMSKAEEKKLCSINLNDDVWIECADILYRRLFQFEQTQFAESEKKMKKMAWSPDKSKVTVEETENGAKITVE